MRYCVYLCELWKHSWSAQAVLNVRYMVLGREKQLEEEQGRRGTRPGRKETSYRLLNFMNASTGRVVSLIGATRPLFNRRCD